MSAKALPKGSLILVTGANGYIGSHIVDKLLGLGYRVRGVARDEKKLAPVLETLRRRHQDADLEGIIVPDIAAENAFRDAVSGCDGVVHVASDLSFDPDPNKTIKTTVQGLKNALHAAADTPSVKRFVFTSSSTAAVRPITNTRFHVDENSWNEEDVRLAWAPPPYNKDRAFSVYSASKVESERMAWEFVKDKGFVFNTVLPNFTLGPIVHPTQSASTAGWVSQLAKGEQPGSQIVSAFPPQYHVNVEDVAVVHVAALLEEDVKGERLFAFERAFNYADIVDSLKKLFPGKTDADFPPVVSEDRDLSTVSNGRAEELLGRYGRNGFVSLTESLKGQFGV